MHMCLRGWGMSKLLLGSYLDTLQENKIFFYQENWSKGIPTLTNLSLVQLDQGAILDKSFWIKPF
jgi:hypothetical protein